METEHDKERLREAHATASSLLAHESNLVWTRYNVFLVANSMFIAAAGVLATQETRVSIHVTLCTCGLLTCLIWFLLTSRGFENCGNYYRLCQELEAAGFPEKLRIHHRVSELTRKGRAIEFDRLTLLSIVVFALPNLVLLVVAFL